MLLYKCPKGRDRKNVFNIQEDGTKRAINKRVFDTLREAIEFLEIYIKAHWGETKMITTFMPRKEKVNCGTSFMTRSKLLKNERRMKMYDEILNKLNFDLERTVQ